MIKPFSLIFFFFLIPYLCLSQENGLVGEYYDGSNFDRKVGTRTDPFINFYWDGNPPYAKMDPQHFSIIWKGKILAPKTGVYKFRAKADDGLRVKVGGKSVIDAWGMNNHIKLNGAIFMRENEVYPISIEYFNGLFEGEIRLFWEIPESDKKGKEIIFGDKNIFTPTSTVPKKLTNPVPKPIKKENPPPVKISKDTIEKYVPKNVNFEKGKSIIIKESYLDLDNLIKFLVRNPSISIQIYGHTDIIGDAKKNLELSQDRANTISEYISSRGVLPTRITKQGFGGSKPLFNNPSGDIRNRRVEFILK
jgi:outer membrane protein OmpA-like peptidoglycan-associated protein